MNNLSEAQRAVEELKETIEKEMSQERLRLYYHLAGNIELRRSNYSKAIENHEKALSVIFSPAHLTPNNTHALFIEGLALAYYKSGDFDKAREEFERIIALTAGRLYYGDIYTKSFYMLGKICEEQGNTAKSIEHYVKFLDLWKDADPGIAEVEDAKDSLANLRNN